VSDPLRRAELAVAAFGLTAFLLALIFVADAVRFHHDVLVDAVEALGRGELHLQWTLLLAAALFDAVALPTTLWALPVSSGCRFLILFWARC